MLALTIRNPWAMLIALGEKRIETRDKPTDYRGWIAIHTSQVFPADGIPKLSEPAFVDALAPHGLLMPTHFPNGYVVAVARLARCFYTGDRGFDYPRGWVPARGSREWRFGDYSPGRYGWVFDMVIELPAGIRQRGKPNLWEFNARLLPGKVYDEMMEPALAL